VVEAAGVEGARIHAKIRASAQSPTGGPAGPRTSANNCGHRLYQALVQRSHEKLLIEMNKSGELGWELVFARRAVGESKASYELIYKRPK
jgi:hypothetical protein